MSSKKKAVRRAGLLAGSSLVASAFAVAAFTGGVAAPGMALAANECAPAGVAPSANGPTADVYSCSGSYAGTGITYSSDGALTVNSTGAINVGTVGVNLTANGADSAAFTSTGTVTGTEGAVIELLSAGATPTPGALNATISGITGTNAAVTYGVNAASTNGAAINLNVGSANVNPGFGSGGAGSQLSAIRAVSTGGNGAVTVSTTGAVTGRVRGIEARSSGTGALTITATGGVAVNNTAGVGVAAIDAQAGTGLLTINIGAGSGIINGNTTANAIRAQAGGDASISIAAGRTVQVNSATSTGALHLTVAGATTLTNAGTISGSANGIAVKATGASLVFNTSGTVTGALDLSGLTGSASITNSGTFSGAIDLSGLVGNATVTHGVNAVWNATGANPFGSGVNTVSTAGVMNVSGPTVFTGVDQFNNSGVIYLGSASAGLAGDALKMEGAAFVATGASRIVLDVNFSGPQTDCSTGAVADCLDVSGGSTTGSTVLTVRYADETGSGSSSNIVVIEGSSAADDFTLDPASQGLEDTASGPMLMRNLYGYRLVYDEQGHNHVLAATPLDVVFQPTTYAAAAQDIWRATTGSWFDRQADLRAMPEGLEGSGGLWARASYSSGERDTRLVASQRLASATSTASYDQKTSHLLFGGDFVGAASQSSSWVLGVTAGFVRSDAEYKGPSAEVSYTGFTGGVYGSWISGPLFVDMNVNANILDVKADIPSLNLATGVNLTQTIQSVGAQVESGWRFAAAEDYFVEPLVGLAYVVTSRDGIVGLDGAPVFGFDDEDAKSLRAGVGLRLGADLGLLGQAASYSLTGRYWEEMEGENSNTLLGSDPTTVVDPFTGSFTEIAAGMNLYSEGGVVSGFLNLGGRFASGYSSVDTALGVRVRW